MNDEVEQINDPLTIRSDKVALTDHFVKSLEALIFLEIAHLYGLDTSLLHILLRATAINYIRDASSKYQKLTIVIIVNLICAVSHIFSEQPAPASYGARMLSGGLLVDFIGEYAYTSRIALVTLDVFIALVMIIMLLAVNDKQKVAPGTARTDAVQDRELEEGQVESSQETDGMLGEETTTTDTSHESERVIRVNVRRSLRDITSDNDSRTTSSSTRSQEALRRVLAALSARTNRGG